VCERYAKLAKHFSEGDLLRLLKITAQTMQAVKFSPQPRVKFEVALIDMIKMDSTIEISTLLSNLSPGGTTPSLRNPGASGERTHNAAQARTVVTAVHTGPPQPPPMRESNATEPLRQAEERYRQALTSASLSAAGSYRPPSPGSNVVTSLPEIPPPAIVQLLIEGLDAVLLPKT
jgi:DNA polymerase III gamma/tau subunit